MRRLPAALAALAALPLAACGAGEPPPTIRLASPSFAYGAGLGATFTCDGDDIPPGISWDGIPAEAKSLVLILEDRDAGGRTHWIVYNIPPTTTGSPEGGSPEGGRPGTNDHQKVGYSGPCPPEGARHRYVFRLLALDTTLELPDGATRTQVEQAMKGHILARGELLATYQR